MVERESISDPNTTRPIAMDLVDKLEGTLLPRQIVFSADAKAWDLLMLKLSTWVVLVSDGLAQTLRSEQMSGFRLTPL